MAQMGLNISTGGRGGDEPKVRAVIVFPENLNFANFPQGYVISYTIRLVDVPPLENTKELFPLFQFPGPNTGKIIVIKNHFNYIMHELNFNFNIKLQRMW